MPPTSIGPENRSPDPETSPRARFRDRMRGGIATGVGVTSVSMGFLLYGQQALQADVQQIAAGLQTMQATVERIQGQFATQTAADRLAHTAIDARLAGHDQQAAVLARDLEGLHRQQADLGSRVTHLERSGADRVALRAPDPAGRLAQLVRAIRSVPADAPGAWTSDDPPKPTTAALSALVGGPVSASERDAACQLAPLVAAGSE